jgi:hypothetical protein
LVPGNTLFLYGGYTLRNPEDQSASVHVHTGSPLIKGLTGFDGVQYMLNLAPENPSGTQAFPKLAFTTPASDKRSLYKVEASGKIYFVSSGDSVTLGAGTWFMGNDTLPPTVRYVSETFDASDSTRVIFEVKDNVANLGYNLIRNDNPARNVSGAFLFSEQAIMAILKHPDSAVKPLYVQMSVSDFLQTAYFPADKSTMLPLSQKLKPLQGPPAWMIGVRPENRYDFVSVPLALEPPLTLEGLSATSSTPCPRKRRCYPAKAIGLPPARPLPRCGCPAPRPPPAAARRIIPSPCIPAGTKSPIRIWKPCTGPPRESWRTTGPLP